MPIDLAHNRLIGCCELVVREGSRGHTGLDEPIEQHVLPLTSIEQVLGTGLLGGKRCLKLEQPPLAVPFHPRGTPNQRVQGSCELSQ